MLDLLAQTAPAMPPTDWLTPLMTQGALGIFFAVFMWLAIWYGPQWIKAHINFVNTTATTQQCMAESMEALTETAKAHGIECKLTRRDLRSLAKAGKAATPKDNGEAHAHLDNVIRDSARETA